MSLSSLFWSFPRLMLSFCFHHILMTFGWVCGHNFDFVGDIIIVVVLITGPRIEISSFFVWFCFYVEFCSVSSFFCLFCFVFEESWVWFHYWTKERKEIFFQRVFARQKMCVAQRQGTCWFSWYFLLSFSKKKISFSKPVCRFNLLFFSWGWMRKPAFWEGTFSAWFFVVVSLWSFRHRHIGTSILISVYLDAALTPVADTQSISHRFPTWNKRMNIENISSVIKSRTFAHDSRYRNVSSSGDCCPTGTSALVGASQQ